MPQHIGDYLCSVVTLKYEHIYKLCMHMHVCVYICVESFTLHSSVCVLCMHNQDILFLLFPHCLGTASVMYETRDKWEWQIRTHKVSASIPTYSAPAWQDLSHGWCGPSCPIGLSSHATCSPGGAEWVSGDTAIFGHSEMAAVVAKWDGSYPWAQA